MSTAKLGLNEPEPPKPRRKPGPKRKPGPRSKTQPAGAIKTGGPRYIVPAVLDHVLALSCLFVGLAALTIWTAHMEHAAAAWATAAPMDVARADLSGLWQQGHRWAQYFAGVVLSVLSVTVVDRTIFRSVTLPEVFANKALHGREGIFEPLPENVRAAALVFYGAAYGSAILAGSLVLGV